MKRVRIVAALAWVALAVSGPRAAAQGQEAPPPDAAAIRDGIERLSARLDACRYVEAVGWDEHVVLLYERLRGREPTREELFLLRTLHEEAHLTRGMSLSFVLRGSRGVPSWEQCRRAPALLADEHLVHELARVDRVRRVELDPLDPVRLASTFAPQRRAPVPFAEPVVTEPELQAGVPYQVYYGYLHAHTGLSDGEGTPLDAYTRARDVGLDFFAVTDHGELLLLWPWDEKWAEILRTADALNDPGRYVTLWGFEWSHPLFGHVNVINPPEFTEILSTFWLRDLYDWIAARPRAFGRFNHPGRLDAFGLEFEHVARYDPALRQMVGMEVWNGNSSFDVFAFGDGWETDFGYWDEANRNGWVLGPVGGQDNHSADWGERGRQRTAVLATSLTRRALLEAYRARRFYATEDPNLVLDVRCQGFPMGARLAGGARTLDVTASDGDGEAFVEARLYRSGELVETRAAAGTTLAETFDDPGVMAPAYYYVVVRQADGDEALSSPIWIDG